MDEKRRLLTAVLDCILPPNQELAGAGSLGLDENVLAEAELIPANGQAMHAVLDHLPADFLNLDSDAQELALRQIESAMPDTFFGLIVMAYNAYYTDTRVLQLIERNTGYAARPPQPLGYELEPFDEQILEKTRQRAPFYRQVG